MRAIVWNAGGRLELAERQEPVAGDADVLVRPAVVGICGSDLHFFRGEFPAFPGSTPGHEIAGSVVSGGGLAPGTPVAIEPTLPCGQCPGCLRGQSPTCSRLRLMGISAPGGLQELVAVPKGNVHVLPEGAALEIGSMAEPLAVCVRALNRAAAPMGARVLVLGSGTIGLLAVLLASQSANEVAVTARYPHQAAMAEAMGAGLVFEPGSPALLDWARRDPVDVVIETVGGTAETFAEAINAVRAGGTVVPLGVFTADVMVPARKLVNQEVRVVGSVVYGHAGHQSEFGAAVGMLGRFAPKLSLLRTATYPLASANEAFEHAADKGRQAVKVSVAVEA